MQIAKDIGGKANVRTLADVAQDYENSSVRRLGYLLDWQPICVRPSDR
jgi:hypothetical protein